MCAYCLRSFAVFLLCDVAVATRSHLRAGTSSNDKPSAGLWKLVDLGWERHPDSFFQRQEEPNTTADVNVFLGSGGHGHTFPGATTPWGMVQATPWVHGRSFSTWDTQSGYSSDAPLPEFFGMAHTALSGAGSGEMGELRLLPVGTRNQKLFLDKKATRASPGYFKTRVAVEEELTAESGQNDVKIETSATPRGAIHRFSFSSSAPEHALQIVLSPVPNNFYGMKLFDYSYEVVSEKRLEGCAESLVIGWGGSISLLCYVIEFEQPFISPKPGTDEAHYERDVRLKFSQAAESVGKDQSPLVVRVAVSRTDLAHARTAFTEEVQGKSFEQIQSGAQQSWDSALGVVQADIKPESRKRAFYSALYHTMIAPNLMSDSDGSYRLQGKPADAAFGPLKGYDGVQFKDLDTLMPVHKAAAGHNQYGTFSLWDTYRSLHPLMNLIQPKVSSDFAQSIVAFADTWKFIPRTEIDASPSDMMDGDGGSIVLATMARQGLVDAATAFQALNLTRRQPAQERQFITPTDEDYGKFGQGYIPDSEEHHVSKALEQGEADSCVSRVARDLQRTNEADFFSKRAELVRQYWDTDTKLYEPLSGRDPGSLQLQKVNQNMQTEGYTEGTALQYSWAAPFDVDWQKEHRGGAEGYVCDLDYFFEHAPIPTGQPDVAGNVHGASLGNEPCMHTPYLYSLAGYASKTQGVMDKAVKTLFSDGPDGLPGNDDMGQMSSWVVFAMLGFYPVDPCSNEFVLGRPFVESAKLSVKGGILELRVHDQDDEHMFIKTATWSGKAIDVAKPVLTYEELTQGGVLEIWMGAEASGPNADCSNHVNIGQTHGFTFD